MSIQLLEDGSDVAAGKDIAGEQQDREAIDGGEGCSRDHIGGARADEEVQANARRRLLALA